MAREKILIVEDDPIEALDLKDELEGLGYVVAGVVTDADVALEAAGRAKPDLVLMDINLKSFIDGVDLSSRLSLFSRSPVIFITAYSDPGLKERALRTRPADYLIKPVRPEVLKDAIEGALGRAAARV